MLVVVRVGSSPGNVRDHHVHQFMAINYTALNLYPMVDPWTCQSIPRRMVLARVDAREDPDLAGLDTGFIFKHLLFTQPFIWDCCNLHRLTESYLPDKHFCVGVLFSIIYLKTKSLRWLIVGHALADFLGLSVAVFLNLWVPPG